MANISKTVQIVFGGKNEVSATIDQIGRSIDGLAGRPMKFDLNLSDAAEKVLKLDAALTALAVGGLVLAIREAGNFNGKFGEITTLISDTGAPIAKFKENIKDYAVDSVKSIDDINQAIYTAVSAGVDYKDAIKFVNEAEKLSVAGRSALGDTTKVLISVLNAYGQSTDQAGKYSDIMFTTVKLGLTTMTELSASLAQVTGLAANSGIPFQTLSAAIAALTTTGMPTAQAITSIKAAIQNIIKPTGEAEEMAKKLGLQFNATALKTKGLEGVLWDAQKATGGNVSKMAELFGSVEALNAVMVLASDKNGKFKSSLEEISKSAGATQVAYNKVANEFANINQRLENSFKITLGEIGEKIMPEYGKIAGALGDLMKGIKVGIDKGAFDPLFNELDAAGKSISGWLGQVAKAFPDALSKVDFTGLAKELRAFGGAFGESFGAADLTKPDNLAKSMQRVIDTLETLVSVTRGIGEPFKPFLDGVTKTIDGFNSMDAGTKTLIGNVMGLSLQYKLFGPVVTAAMLLLGSDTEGGANKARIAFAALENGINVIKVGVTALGLMFATMFLDMAKALDFIPGYDAAEGIARNTTRVKELGDALNKYEGDLIKSTQKLKDAYAGIAPPIDAVTAAQAAWNRKVSDASTVYVQTGDTMETLGKKIAVMVGQAGSGATSADKLADAIQAEIKSGLQAGDTMETLGKKIAVMVDQAEGGITSADILAGAIKNIPALTEIKIGVQADGSTIEKAYGMIIKRFPDGSPVVITNVGVEANALGLDAVKKKIDDAIPKEKLLEIQATIDVAKIKAQSDIVQKSIEWIARVDIAQVESATAKVKAMYDSINTSITSSGSLLTGLFGSLNESIGKGTTGTIEMQIATESKRRDEAMKLQKDLITAEIVVLTERARAIGKGEGIIKIESSSLAPHLEAFMYEILKAIQVKANSEGMKFLVGS